MQRANRGNRACAPESRLTCSRCSGVRPSHLLTATTSARPASTTKPAMCASCSMICLARIEHQDRPRWRPPPTAASSSPRISRPPRRPCRAGAGPRYRSACSAGRRARNRRRSLSRVVPGWSKAMTRSSPSSALTSVDLPTLGRPTIAMRGRVRVRVSSSSSRLGASPARRCRRDRTRPRHAPRKSRAARPGRARGIRR